VPPRPVGAQHADSLHVGVRARVKPAEAPTTWVTGTVVRADRDTLTLAERGGRPPRAFAWGEVRRVERLVAREPAGAAFVRGARWGALTGVAASAVAVGSRFAPSDARPPTTPSRDACSVRRPSASRSPAPARWWAGSVALAFRERWHP
jgi:hypothetical protein